MIDFKDIIEELKENELDGIEINIKGNYVYIVIRKLECYRTYQVSIKELVQANYDVNKKILALMLFEINKGK